MTLCPVILPQRLAWCSTYCSLHLSILTNPLVQHSFILDNSTLSSERKNSESVPTHTPDDIISFNLMSLICEIKAMPLIKWHYVEVGRFALKIFSFEGFRCKMTYLPFWTESLLERSPPFVPNYLNHLNSFSFVKK